VAWWGWSGHRAAPSATEHVRRGLEPRGRKASSAPDCYGAVVNQRARAIRLSELMRWVVLDRPPGIHGSAAKITSHRNSSAELRRTPDSWVYVDDAGQARAVTVQEMLDLVDSGQFRPVYVHVQPDTMETLFKRAVTLAAASVQGLRRVSARLEQREQAPDVMLFVENSHDLDESLASAMLSIVAAIAAGEAQLNAWAHSGLAPDREGGLHERLTNFASNHGHPLTLSEGPLAALGRTVDRRNDVIHGSTALEQYSFRQGLTPGRTESVNARKACIAVRQSLLLVATTLGLEKPRYLAYCPAARADDDNAWATAVLLTGTRPDPDFPTVAESLRDRQK
jgi:hypothetical protein